MSADGASSWAPLNAGLPNVAVSDLAIDRTAGFFETVNEFAVREAVDFGSYANAHDPQAAEISFSLLSVFIIKGHR